MTTKTCLNRIILRLWMSSSSSRRASKKLSIPVKRLVMVLARMRLKSVRVNSTRASRNAWVSCDPFLVSSAFRWCQSLSCWIASVKWMRDGVNIESVWHRWDQAGSQWCVWWKTTTFHEKQSVPGSTVTHWMSSFTSTCRETSDAISKVSTLRLSAQSWRNSLPCT